MMRLIALTLVIASPAAAQLNQLVRPTAPGVAPAETGVPTQWHVQAYMDSAPIPAAGGRDTRIATMDARAALAWAMADHDALLSRIGIDPAERKAMTAAAAKAVRLRPLLGEASADTFIDVEASGTGGRRSYVRIVATPAPQ
ncbi:hypothetical protein SLG_22270 [Sphingobium sp. SYK-6]|uniref:hypothetical protein n=1 Tax=Sphingobium sp. (strain NBRC 103272 / SYK-6) TaxID=627192 RepID=UPI0002277142|nr:hypothetical protein [Sphingobium sp. SYK-6]BAK66902.1 hypothetical protein SLG_22270 [Sphingobium sp. SYK-6]